MVIEQHAGVLVDEGRGAGGTWNWEPPARLLTNGYIGLRSYWKRGTAVLFSPSEFEFSHSRFQFHPWKLPEGWNTLGGKGPVKLNNVKSLLPEPKSDCPGQSGNLTVAAWLDLSAQGKSKNNDALFSSITCCTYWATYKTACSNCQIEHAINPPFHTDRNVNKVSWHFSANGISTKHSPTCDTRSEDCNFHINQTFCRRIDHIFIYFWTSKIVQFESWIA